MVCVQWKGKHSTCTVSFCLSSWFTPKCYGLGELYFLVFVSPELCSCDHSINAPEMNNGHKHNPDNMKNIFTVPTCWYISMGHRHNDSREESHMCRQQKSGQRSLTGHLESLIFWWKFLQNGHAVLFALYFDVFPWDLTHWSLGKFAHETSTEMKSKGHLGSLTFWLMIWNMITVYIYFDVFPWDPWVELHVTTTKVGSKVTLGSLTFWLQFLNNCHSIFSMEHGHNNPWVESYMWCQQKSKVI